MLFITPLIALSLHAFSNHEHGVCISKIETHLHEKDADCSLHLIKQNDSFLTENTFTETIELTFNSIAVQKYSYLKNHSQLAFSLRGPPAFI